MLRDLISIARPTQWLKNGIVMAALVFAGELSDTAKLERAILAMLLFCLL